MGTLRTLLCLVFAAAPALLLPAVGHAQASDAPAISFRNPWPTPNRSSLGLNLSRSQYNSIPCGSVSLLCDVNGRTTQLLASVMVGNFWGVELGYLNMGRIARGGNVAAQ